MAIKYLCIAIVLIFITGCATGSSSSSGVSEFNSSLNQFNRSLNNYNSAQRNRNAATQNYINNNMYDARSR